MVRRMALELAQRLERHSLRRWQRRAAEAEKADLVHLRALRNRASALRKQLNRVIHVADGRLALPRVGADAIEAPIGADWVCRPAMWRGAIPVPGRTAVEAKTPLGGQVTIFHDAGHPEVAVRHVRNRRADDLAPYGLRMEVFDFDGTFLSAVVDLPDEALAGLRRDSIVQLNVMAEAERPVGLTARLNVRHGPNTEQMVQPLGEGTGSFVAEFDLAYTGLDDRRIEGMWIDLILDRPWMNQITLRDVTVSRRPRAPL
ncbi:hypothetical protein SAMN04490244_10963 [Tranquillimonas rosea]|uniref:Uncharacterized protein n=1 Tax=Tranquillimonas rosea TaxID=641238 RepID=A0A1H9W3U3_9RHOB|nr:DUF6478 family protein [Tranquillimonas rosea]SES28474.1 hypothetical protein SAMN04490244_10963 [Tranquillimonas rosea]